MQTPLLFRNTEGSAPARAPGKRGAVYTKPWITELILDMAGYEIGGDLAAKFAVEPATGEGAFLMPMAVRLIRSARAKGRGPVKCRDSLLAYELHQGSADIARATVSRALIEEGVPDAQVDTLTDGWRRVGDYLAESPALPRADLVVCNPPYIRLEDAPADLAGYYRSAYATMKGRADLYVAFFEAALRQLTEGGVCAFICTDRWMLNHYGGELRRLVTSKFAVEAVVEMHKADAFDTEVSAYPAVTIIRRAPQRSAVVASVGRDAGGDGCTLAKGLRLRGDGRTGRTPEADVPCAGRGRGDRDRTGCLRDRPRGEGQGSGTDARNVASPLAPQEYARSRCGPAGARSSQGFYHPNKTSSPQPAARAGDHP